MSPQSGSTPLEEKLNFLIRKLSNIEDMLRSQKTVLQRVDTRVGGFRQDAPLPDRVVANGGMGGGININSSSSDESTMDAMGLNLSFTRKGRATPARKKRRASNAPVWIKSGADESSCRRFPTLSTAAPEGQCNSVHSIGSLMLTAEKIRTRQVKAKAAVAEAAVDSSPPGRSRRTSAIGALVKVKGKVRRMKEARVRVSSIVDEMPSLPGTPAHCRPMSTSRGAKVHPHEGPKSPGRSTKGPKSELGSPARAAGAAVFGNSPLSAPTSARCAYPTRA